MIHGIGVDILRISRMERLLDRWGARFVNRVFTGAEVETCRTRARPAAAYALRFAAKEALSKALGLGLTGGVRWRDMEVYHQPGGRPALRVHGRCAEICGQRGIRSMHLSLSDEGDYGVAMVILEADDEAGDGV
ncbi:MAG: holo-ACP synthase [Deltaproteobacteria bacterium]|nr:holo-ACP synthase [Deltaproteobacteria bacterium]MBW1923190.1 holo-ACP synthase [Deltaproteobacteria bacterium]MBW1948275.1 holo-ACP synthase [Deltaproteobacteria bacterium]MBW2006772.1 holo-ACP synthase [Deltaproteobacteria bacterium]MBW2101512.1 holo-ACP synthase [Deltaproteobacteria bacterium]